MKLQEGTIRKLDGLRFVAVLGLRKVAGSVGHENVDARLVAAFLTHSLESFQDKERRGPMVSVAFVRMRSVDVFRHVLFDQLNQCLNDRFAVIGQVFLVSKTVRGMVRSCSEHEEILAARVLEDGQ